MSINGSEESILSRYILRVKKNESCSLVCRDAASGNTRTLKLVITEEK